MQQLLAVILMSVGPQRVGEIAAALGITISSASGLVERLARAGLVLRSRSTADRRAVICQLSLEGDSELREHLDIGRLRLEQVLAELSRDELISVEHALDLLIGAARTVVADTQSVKTQVEDGLSTK